MAEPLRLQHPLQHIAPTPPQRNVDMHESTYRSGDRETVPPAEARSWVHGYVVSGSVRLAVDDRDWGCGPGDSIVIDGKRGYHVTGESDDPARVVWFITGDTGF
ncbi:cupin domain-containing protein [Herbiconiux daphne]|uniref:Cupin domain-containing protein n=1 Tax=Herbiconiux daphne TaxID=2970914 RepID=A0ABT2H5F4_9MICO|nr:cupin domain-containing protein [Herbiconiux daphne]MCS5735170.1 cupin domain-containing protein [Herbiconiux daphne]